MTKGERRQQKQHRAFKKAYYGHRNNRKALEVLIQARANRVALDG